MTVISVSTVVRPLGETLAWSRATIEPALRAAVDRLPAPLSGMVGYHFGWRDSRGLPSGGSAGKAIRPALALLSAEVTGGSAAAAVPAAVAVELVHNFSLIHDDVMDGDATRRHRPTVWSVFGVREAVLAGDAILAQASWVLTQGDAQSARLAVRRLNECVVELCAGQFADIGFEQQVDVGVAPYLAMAMGKTGSLLGCACGLGALLGGADAAHVQLVREFGQNLGLAFQLADDLLGIWGDPDVTGKPVGADLTRRKKTLPVVAALASRTSASLELANLYRGREDLTSEQSNRAAVLIEQSGARDWVREMALEKVNDAKDCLAQIAGRARATAELEALADLVITRNH